MDEKDKYVDESWKDAVASEKEKKDNPSEEVASTDASAAPVEEGEMNPEEFNFLAYISSLAFQAMIFLGEIPNPVTHQVEKNLRQAKFLIDTLTILKDKTKGNLDKQESDMLNGALYELQTRFIELISQPESGPGEMTT